MRPLRHGVCSRSVHSQKSCETKRQWPDNQHNQRRRFNEMFGLTHTGINSCCFFYQYSWSPLRHYRKRKSTTVRCRKYYKFSTRPSATIASCISIASACAPFAIYFDLIPHALHIGSIVNSSAESELS